jgi:hypothetical protein
MTNREWLEEVHFTAAAYKMETFINLFEICENSSVTITSLIVNLFNGITSCYSAVNVTETPYGNSARKCLESSFGGLGVACLPLLSKFAGSNPAKAVGFLGVKKSSAHLPSEGK